MPGKNILICCRASGNGDGSKANHHVARKLFLSKPVKKNLKIKKHMLQYRHV